LFVTKPLPAVADGTPGIALQNFDPAIFRDLARA
jgi:hypothetical protein